MFCCDVSAIMGVYMKVLMFTGPQTFMLCCVRWPDMAVIGKSYHASDKKNTPKKTSAETANFDSTFHNEND